MSFGTIGPKWRLPEHQQGRCWTSSPTLRHDFQVSSQFFQAVEREAAVVLRVLVKRVAERCHEVRVPSGHEHSPDLAYHLPRIAHVLQHGVALNPLKHVIAERQALRLEKQLATADYRDNPAFRVWVAETRLGAGKADEALRLLEKVLQDDPDYAPDAPPAWARVVVIG